MAAPPATTSKLNFSSPVASILSAGLVPIDRCAEIVAYCEFAHWEADCAAMCAERLAGVSEWKRMQGRAALLGGAGQPARGRQRLVVEQLALLEVHRRQDMAAGVDDVVLQAEVQGAVEVDEGLGEVLLALDPCGL